MSGDKQELSAEELEQEGAAELPEREAMSVIDGPVANPVNAASVINFLAPGANETATQTQEVNIVQHR